MRIITVGRNGARMARTPSGFSFPVWSVKLYEARARQSDGVLTYRLRDVLSCSVSGRAPSARLMEEAMAIAHTRGLRFALNVVQGTLA